MDRTICPAKVNLFLSVGPPEPSGMHPIRTIFQAVSLCDDLEITWGTDSDSIECDWTGLPEQNTLTKTLRLTRELTEVPPCAIKLTKRIPSEAGLGGGSSNAAGLLRLILRRFPDFLSEQDAQQIASGVGADVSFFLTGGRAIGTHYGEKIEPLPDQDEQWFVLAKPEQGVSTGAAYKMLDEAPREWRDLPETDVLYNDFELAAPNACQDLAEHMKSLGSEDTLLCGSGSTVFGLASSEAQAQFMADQLKIFGCQDSFSVRSLTREESLWTS